MDTHCPILRQRVCTALDHKCIVISVTLSFLFVFLLVVPTSCACVPLIITVRVISFLPIATETCQDDFYLILDQSKGKATDCFHLATFHGVSRSECFEETCEIGGNAINFLGSSCNAKRCVDPLQLKLTDKYGGWEVYVLNPQGIGNSSNDMYSIIISLMFIFILMLITSLA